jgi:uncharacterized protein with HEPN domain
MSDEKSELLQDILQQAQPIKEFVAGYSYDDYCSDKKTRFAVERCFEIIGEAMTRLARIDPEGLESIRDHRSIKSFRNILAHAYDHVEDKLVWGIIERDLGNLMEDVKRIL